FHAPAIEQPDNLNKLHNEAHSFCIENGKHLMIVKSFRKPDDDNTYHIKPETFITCLFNFLLDKHLLQHKYVPRKAETYEREVQMNNGTNYAKDSYFDNLRDFTFMVMRLLESQVNNGMLYSPRSELIGNNDEFVVFPGEFY